MRDPVTEKDRTVVGQPIRHRNMSNTDPANPRSRQPTGLRGISGARSGGGPTQGGRRVGHQAHGRLNRRDCEGDKLEWWLIDEPQAPLAADRARWLCRDRNPACKLTLQFSECSIDLMQSNGLAAPHVVT